MADQDQNAVLISELCASDGQLGPTLRAVYDGGRHESFMETLDTFIQRMDAEIEKMCNHNYQGFIESVDELLKVRADAVRLRELITASDESRQATGKFLLGKAQELMEARVVLRNVVTAIESLNTCRPVLQLYTKAVEQLQQKKYYPALKALDQLEKQHLPRVSQYGFASQLHARIPLLRKRIKATVLSDLQDWLAKIRKQSTELGRTAMDETKVMMRALNADDKESASTALSASTAPGTSGTGSTPRGRTATTVGAQRRPKGFLFKAREDPIEVGVGIGGGASGTQDAGAKSTEASGGQPSSQSSQSMSSGEVVEFSAVYRCLHIFEVLGCRSEFEAYYKEARRQQASLVLQPLVQAQSSSADTFSSCKDHFYQVVGFFLVENTVINTTQALLTQGALDESWEIAITQISAFLQIQSNCCGSASLLLEVKEFMVLFCQTLQINGYNVTRLLDLLLEMRDGYTDILMRDWEARLRAAIAADTYEPMQVKSLREFETLQVEYPHTDPPGPVRLFPSSLPFSASVPKIYTEIREFAYAALKFVDQLHLSHTETDDMVRRAANRFLGKTVKEAMIHAIDSATSNVSQLVQITINAGCLAHVAPQLDVFVASLTRTVSDGAHVIRLIGPQVFKEARQLGEEAVLRRVRGKVDDFFTLASYNWTATKGEDSPSEYMVDLITFLRTTFGTLSAFQSEYVDAAYATACEHLVTRLISLLTSDNVKRMHISVFDTLAKDVTLCEAFAQDCPIASIKEHFYPLRQMITLFVKWDFSNFLLEEKRKYLYPRVYTPTVVTLLEKLKEEDSIKFSFMRSAPPNKNKEIDVIVKNLRDLIALQQHLQQQAK
eukprot:Opistho-2@81683